MSTQEFLHTDLGSYEQLDKISFINQFCIKLLVNVSKLIDWNKT